MENKNTVQAPKTFVPTPTSAPTLKPNQGGGGHSENGNGNGKWGCGHFLLASTPFMLLLASAMLTWYSVARLFKWTGWLYDAIQLPASVEPFLIPLAILFAVAAVIFWAIIPKRD